MSQTFQRTKALFLATIFMGALVVPLVSQTLIRADSPACMVSQNLVNSCRPWLGGAANSYTAAASDSKSQLLYQEQRQGRQNDVVHTYHAVGNNTLSSTDVYFATRPNTLLFTNWKPTNNWANIASQNAGIDSMANSVKALGSTRIFMTLFHEPENDVSPGGDANCPNVTYKGTSGTVADYRNMWAYVENRFAADGVTNVVWAMTYMDYSPWFCLDYDLYPGDNLIDWIAFDVYGSKTTPDYNTAVGQFYNLLASESDSTPGSNHNFLSKPWGVAEWGATNTTAQEQAFYDGGKAALDSNTFPNLKMYMIFDEYDTAGNINRRVGYDDDGTVDTTKGAHYYAFANDPKLLGSWQFVDGAAPSVPGSLTATATDPHQVSLAWQAATDNVGVAGYDVYRNGTQIATATGTSYVDTGLTDATAYTYIIAAYDAAGNVSLLSNVATVNTPDGTAPDVPAGLTAVAASDSEVDLSWNASSDNVGTTGYKLYRDGVQIANLGTATTYQDTAVSAQTHYAYTISAYDAAGNASAQSSAAEVTTPDVPTPPDTQAPTIPTDLAATVSGGHEVDLSWDASTDDTAVAGYTIYRDGQVLATVSGDTLAYADTGADDATAYAYTISAYDAAGNASAQSDGVNATTPDVTAPSTPVTVTAALSSDGTSVDVTWQPSLDNTAVTGYNIYRNGLLVGIITDGTTTYSDNNLQQGESYTYTVAAYDAAGNVSAQSVAAVAAAPDTTAPTTPDNFTATVANGHEIDLVWQPATDNVGVAGYNIYRNGVLIASVTNGTTYADTSADDATAYTYTIAAYDAAGNTSVQSAAVSATTPDASAPTSPAGVQTTALDASTVQISWQAATDNVGTTGYNIYRNGVLVGTTTNTTFTDTGLSDATAYQYAIAAYDAAGNVSVLSGTASVTTPDGTAPSVPVNVQATPVSGSEIDLTWQSAVDNTGVVGYNLYRDGVLIATIATNTYVDSGLNDATTHYYAVSAFDAAGNVSAQSDIVSATTPDNTPPSVPLGVSAIAQSGNSAQVTWQSATDNVGVVTYNIYRNGSLIATVAGTTYADTSLSDATSYSYTVVAVDAAGNASAASTAAAVTTPDVTAPNIPTGLTATAVSSSQINLSWQAATDNVGTTGYNIYRNGVLLATVTGTSYQDTGLAASTAYSYKVLAFDASGNTSAVSGDVTTTTQSAADTTPPTKPTNFRVVNVTSTTETLSWTASSDNVGVVGYQIYRKTTLVATVTGTTYIDTGLTPDSSYTYHIYAIDAAGNLSAAATATTVHTLPDTTSPTTPTGVTAAMGTTSTMVALGWSACTDDVAVAGYRVYRGSTLIATVSGGTLSYTDSGLTSGATYSYHIVAIDAAGNASASSVTVSAKAK